MTFINQPDIRDQTEGAWTWAFSINNQKNKESDFDMIFIVYWTADKKKTKLTHSIIWEELNDLVIRIHLYGFQEVDHNFETHKSKLISY